MKKRLIILLATLALCTFAACEIKVELTIVPPTDPTESTEPLQPEENPAEGNPQGEEDGEGADGETGEDKPQGQPEDEASNGTDDESKEPSDKKPNVVPPITGGGDFSADENYNN